MDSWGYWQNRGNLQIIWAQIGHSKKGKRGGVDCYLSLTNFNPLRFVQISSDMSSWMTASRSWTLFLAEFWVPYFEISQFVDVASWDPFTSKHLRFAVNGSVISCWELRWTEALWSKQTNRDGFHIFVGSSAVHGKILLESSASWIPGVLG